MASRGAVVGWVSLAVVGVPIAAALVHANFGDLSISQTAWYRSHHLRFGLFEPRCVMSSEMCAMLTLRNVSSSQAQFQASGSADGDRDGVGEYGTFLELSGAVAPRQQGHPINPPVLSGVFRMQNAAGEVQRSGYLFRIWLPGRDGSPVAEAADGLAGDRVDPDGAESRWRCYSWPSRHDWSGLRTFFIDERDDIYATEDARYSGSGAGPAPDAADGRSGSPDSFVGSDGNVWRRVN